MLKRVWQMGPLVLATLLVVTWAPTPLLSLALAQEGAQQDEAEQLDEIVLSTGRVVRGKVISENDREIVFDIIQAGMAPYRVTYPRSDVQRITRNVAPAPAIADARGADEVGNDDDGTIDPDAALIYEFSIRGQFGRDVSQSPIRDIFDDVNEIFNDAVPNPEAGGPATVVDPAVRDKHIVLITIDTAAGQQGFLEIFRAEEILPIFEEEIHLRGRRVVFIVEQAINGAAFLAWLSPEMYFTPEGIMYFTNDFDLYDTGDEMVDEKLIGAHVGTAQGFTILGGYAEVGPQIIKAMARSQYWLSVKWTGTTPKLSMRPPRATDAAEGWEILTDNGRDENLDTLEQFVRNPNDQLRLKADVAFRLGVSDGTIRDRDELLFMLGVYRNHHFVDHDARDILGAWQRDLRNFNEQAFPGSQQQPPGDLWRDYYDIQVRGDFQDRRKARGRQMNLLGQIRSKIKRVDEVVDAQGQLISQIETLIYQIQTQQQIDSENR